MIESFTSRFSIGSVWFVGLEARHKIVQALTPKLESSPLSGSNIKRKYSIQRCGVKSGAPKKRVVMFMNGVKMKQFKGKKKFNVKREEKGPKITLCETSEKVRRWYYHNGGHSGSIFRVSFLV